MKIGRTPAGNIKYECPNCGRMTMVMPCLCWDMEAGSVSYDADDWKAWRAEVARARKEGGWPRVAAVGEAREAKAARERLMLY